MTTATSSAAPVAPVTPVEPASVPVFFELNARYLVAPDAMLPDLLEDLGVLLQTGISAVNDQVQHQHFTPGQWGGMYMLHQAQALLKVIAPRVFEHLPDEPLAPKQGGAA